MMLPVATSVIDLVARQQGFASASEAVATPGSALRPFGLCLLLGIAYAASIGGVGTPVGTPPNLFVVSYARSHLGHDISFGRWMAMALPLVVLFLPLAWWLLVRVLHPLRLDPIEGGTRLVRGALRDLGPMQAGERIALGAFLLASGLWLARPLLTEIEIAGLRPLAGLSDPGIAMLVALLLFVVPVDRGFTRFALDWNTAARLPWGILLLFGGGLSLAAAIDANGDGQWLGASAVAIAGAPPLLVLAAVVTGVIFLTELTSNTATTATLTPVLAALAPTLGIAPLGLVVPAALAASCAFMLPVATPPNAVVFGSGLLGISDMSRTGFWLNWIGVALISACGWGLVGWMVGM